MLVCCENYIIYRHMDAPQHRVPIPRRRYPKGVADSDGEERGIIIVSAVMHKMKVRAQSVLFCRAAALTLHRASLTFSRVISSSCSNRKRVTCSR